MKEPVRPGGLAYAALTQCVRDLQQRRRAHRLARQQQQEQQQKQYAAYVQQQKQKDTEARIKNPKCGADLVLRHLAEAGKVIQADPPPHTHTNACSLVLKKARTIVWDIPVCAYTPFSCSQDHTASPTSGRLVGKWARLSCTGSGGGCTANYARPSSHHLLTCTDSRLVPTRHIMHAVLATAGRRAGLHWQFGGPQCNSHPAPLITLLHAQTSMSNNTHTHAVFPPNHRTASVEGWAAMCVAAPPTLLP
jgi:hypothetical protein